MVAEGAGAGHPLSLCSGGWQLAGDYLGLTLTAGLLQEAGAQGQAGRGVELLGDLLQHSSCALKLHLLQPLLHGLQECTGLWQSHRLQRMHP